MKKTLSFLLSVVMVTSMVSTPAFAINADAMSTQDTSEEYVLNEDGTRNSSVTIADVDELYFELDKAIATEDKEAEAEIRNELENAGVRQISFAEVLAKTGGTNSAIAPLAEPNIEFDEVPSYILVDGERVDILRIHARPQSGSDMFHSHNIVIDAQPNLRAATFNAIESAATFFGGEIPKVGFVISALTTLNSILGGFTAQDVVESLDADFRIQHIENTVFIYFWNENTNNWTHIGTGNYISERYFPEYINIVTDEEEHVDRFTGDAIPVITRNQYNSNWDNASVYYEYWWEKGPCRIYQIDEITTEVTDGNNDDKREYTFSMQCPYIPALCS